MTVGQRIFALRPLEADRRDVAEKAGGTCFSSLVDFSSGARAEATRHERARDCNYFVSRIYFRARVACQENAGAIPAARAVAGHRSSSVRCAMKPERLSPAERAKASSRSRTRRGREIFTRSIVSSNKRGQGDDPERPSGVCRGFRANAPMLEGAGIASPASRAASIHAAAASSAPAKASSSVSPAEQPGRSGTTTPKRALPSRSCDRIAHLNFHL